VNTGCPICGFDYAGWSLFGQMGHLVGDHTWWQRCVLRWRTRTYLKDLLINRKYGARP
jgi:hypothetical protein